ncbi:MAG: TIR domain-containing protein, partial [Thermoanaerobaculia bacterium]
MSISTRPLVFLSYSHKDEIWKDRLATALKVLELQDELEVWDDRRIAAGDGWFAEIEQAMNHAAVAVLLVSTDFLASGFIHGTEVPHLLKRRQEEGLRIIPLFVRPSSWQAVPWLAAIQGRPKNAKPLSEHRKAKAEKVLADLALEIRDWLHRDREPPVREAPNGGAGVKPGVSTPGSAPPTLPSPAGAEASARGGNPGRAGGLPASLRDSETLGGPPPGVETPGFTPAPPLGALPRLDLGRLPIAGPLLLGRDSELARLDAAWEDSGLHVLTFVAFGGMGKSALLSHWLDRMAADGWRGARRVLDWSLYSQGTEERVTSADRFLDHALGWF